MGHKRGESGNLGNRDIWAEKSSEYLDLTTGECQILPAKTRSAGPVM